MIISIDNRAATVTLGRQGENLARTICIDISRWVEEFGDGTAVLLAQRPNETSTYPATVTVSGSVVSWPITNADTANAGIGAAELQYIVGEVVVKSHTMRTLIASSLEESGDAPDPESGWVAGLLEQVQETAGDAATAAVEDVVQEALTPPVYNLAEMGIASVAIVSGSGQVAYDTTALIADLQAGSVTFEINLQNSSYTIPMTMTGHAAYGNIDGTEAYEMTQVFYYDMNILISVVVYALGMVWVITEKLIDTDDVESIETRVATLENTTATLTELLDASDCEDGTILVTKGGKWVRLVMELEDITEEEF